MSLGAGDYRPRDAERAVLYRVIGEHLDAFLVLACPRCGGRLRLMATVEDPDAIRAILAAVARSRETAGRAPPFAPTLHTSHAAAIGT